MYGYGGIFQHSQFSMPENMSGYDIVEWARKGRIYAHCILRGGGEYGTKWHEAGMKLNKKNAFYDFIDIAEWLVEQGQHPPGENRRQRREQRRSADGGNFHAASGSVRHGNRVRSAYGIRSASAVTIAASRMSPSTAIRLKTRKR